MKVSVITGIYFPLEILFRKFLDSCLNTTLEGVEFMLIFDHPEDILSRKILQEYQDKINKNKNVFTIIENKENLGIKALYDTFTPKCMGEYIMHLDQDDFFDNDYIEIMYKYAHKYSIECLRGYAITHYYGNIDLRYNGEYEKNVLGIYRGFNTDDWCHIIRKDKALTAKAFLDSMSDYTTTPVSVLPFQLATFYHYVRHWNNETAFHKEPDNDAQVVQKSRFDKQIIRPHISDNKLMRL